MKKRTETKKLKMVICAMALGLSTNMYAQTIIEGENPNEVKFGSEQEGTALSGGKAISFCDAYGESYGKYNLNVAEEGTYDLELYYVTAQVRSMAIQINNQKTSVLTFDQTTPNWDGTDGVGENQAVIPGILTKKIQVYLNKGDNTIRLSGYTGAESDYSPNIDKFSVSRSATEITKPIDQNLTAINLEAENADVVYGCVINDFAAYSGTKGIGDMSAAKGSYFRFNSVQIPTAGVYDVLIYYTTMSGRNIYTKVNLQGKKSVNCGVTTPDWGNSVGDGTKPDVNCKRIAVYFGEGINSLEVGASEGWAPNVDKVVILPSALETIDIPARANEAFDFDYTDLKVRYSEETATNSENLDKLFDNDDATLYKVPGVTSTKVTVELKYPILLTSYGYATSLQNPANTDDWKLEYSIDGSTWETVPVSGSVADRNGYNFFTTSIGKDNRISAKHYRLTATGTSSVEIGEWQLNGLPYVSEAQHFPSDLTVDEQNAATGTLFASDDGFERGTWNEVFENSIDKKIDTKYTVGGKTSFYLNYFFNDPTIVKSYALSVPFELADRNPKNWTLSGMNPDTEEWIILDSRTNIQFPGINSTLMYNIATPGSYYNYKLDVTANNGSGDSHLNQWQLFGEEFITTKLKDTNLTAFNGLQVLSGKSKLILISTEEQPYTIFNLFGKVAAKGISKNSKTEIDLTSGIYLIQSNGITQKVMIP